VEPPDPSPETHSLLQEIRKSNELTAELIRQRRDWRLALRQGMIAGFGGALGATVLVSAVIWTLRPLERLGAIGPAIERLTTALERRPPR
jgi:hypothetical protein